MMRRAQPWLGTLVEISAPDAYGLDAVNQAFEAVAQVHRLMSFHAPDSDVTRLNRARPGQTLAVGAHTWQVLRLADEVMHLSEGLFNIACAPQLVAWGCLPAIDGEAERPRYRSGLALLRLEQGNSVTKLAPGWIDLGGIAKGYAVDAAVAVLQQAGAETGCVNAGGDLRVFGAQAWPVAVRAPAAPHSAGLELSVCNEALATSANYFTPGQAGGAPLSALVHGHSGAPLAGARSVSVRAPACALADALTKVVMASGDARHPALARLQATAFII